MRPIRRSQRGRTPGCGVPAAADRCGRQSAAAWHNNKSSNLINMLAKARHPLLVIADSDISVEPDYLRHRDRAAAGSHGRPGDLPVA